MSLIIKSDKIRWLKNVVRIHDLWDLREYVNPINHEPYVQFKFSKLFWNPYNIFKSSYFITFYD